MFDLVWCYKCQWKGIACGGAQYRMSMAVPPQPKGSHPLEVKDFRGTGDPVLGAQMTRTYVEFWRRRWTVFRGADDRWTPFLSQPHPNPRKVEVGCPPVDSSSPTSSLAPLMFYFYCRKWLVFNKIFFDYEIKQISFYNAINILSKIWFRNGPLITDEKP